MGFILQFCVRSIISEPFERFIVNFTQMSVTVGQCAEPMNRVCRLKAKVNLQGHRMYPLKCDPIPLLYHIWQQTMLKLKPLHFSVRSISPEPFERFSLNFTQMFLCRTHDLAMQPRGQCSSSSWDLPLKLVSAA